MTTPNPKVFVNDKARPPRQPGLEPVSGNLSEFWSMLCRRVPCEQCHVEENQPCASTSEAKPGTELEGYHRARFLLAKKTFGRK